MTGYIRFDTNEDGKFEGYNELYHPDEMLVEMELNDTIDYLIEQVIADEKLVLDADAEYLMIFKHNYNMSYDYEGFPDYESWIELIHLEKLANISDIVTINYGQDDETLDFPEFSTLQLF